MKKQMTALAALLMAAAAVTGVMAEDTTAAVTEAVAENSSGIYSIADLPDYESHDSGDCPYCKAGQKIDALVNSFGYTEL